MNERGIRSFAVPPLLITIGITYFVLILVSGPQALDPMLRHDDFPALLADPSGFYVKTLEEGRWLNYWWHLRGWISPAWLNFAVYQFLWATFAGAAAINACGKKEQLTYTIALALIIALATPALLISLWFNTLIPGLGLVALFAALATFLSAAHTRLLLLVFVPLTLMAYTTYPFLLLAICLTTHGITRSWRDLTALMGIFVVSFILSILLIYSINYVEHGIFGIPVAEWRGPKRAHDLASVFANLHLISDFIAESIMVISYDVVPLVVLNGLILVVAFIVSIRAEPWVTLYIFTGILTGLSLIFLQMLLNGVTVPPRALGFVWMLYCILCVRAALKGRDRGGRYASISWALIVFSVTIYFVCNAKHYFLLSEWQVETRKLADQVGDGVGPVYLMGSYKALPGAKAAGIQQPRGLRSRLTYLTEREVYSCEETPDACKELLHEITSDQTISTAIVRQFPDRTEIHLPTLAE